MLIHQRKAEVVIFVSDKADITAKKMIRHKKGHWIMMKGSVLQEDINNS